MSGDVHVQFSEGPKVKFLRSTQPKNANIACVEYR